MSGGHSLTFPITCMYCPRGQWKIHNSPSVPCFTSLIELNLIVHTRKKLLATMVMTEKSVFVIEYTGRPVE